jgi:hypothetical protein
LPEPHLHIVSFDVPWPPSYGGVIDVFYKVKALSELGVRVHLHCFAYGRARSKELAALCHEVHYYQRRMGRHQLLGRLPFVVLSRRSDALADRLLKDDHPILFEGLHTCHLLTDPRFQGRRRIVRAHNVEHDYYAALAKAEAKAFRRTYFINEARKLHRFEPVLAEADHVLAISPKDAAYFTGQYGHVSHIPAFHASEQVNVPPGMGDFAFYHGALGVAENDQAALYLVRQVFKGLGVKLIIAGSEASQELKREVARTPNVELREGIGTDAIHELVRQAQVNVLPTFQATGIKLKLLLCLYNGRHVVCNTPMIEGTGLESLCHVHDSASAMRASILACMQEPVNDRAAELRTAVLGERFCNARNAQRIVELLG